MLEQKNSSKGLWILIAVALAVVGLVLGFIVGSSWAQTPPVSTISTLPDTTYTQDLVLVVTVSSSVPWDEELVGVYWTTEFMEGWNYAGATRDTLLWTAPADTTEYFFSSTVDDNDGNSEGYEFETKAQTFVCTTCTPEECPPTSPLQALQILAAAGFDMEADTPVIRWWWTHPTTGSPVVEYVAEWDVDGFISTIPGIAVGDTTFAIWDAPYTIGQSQRIRVFGKDALERPGDISLWSELWTDDGPPGVVDVPRGTLMMID